MRKEMLLAEWNRRRKKKKNSKYLEEAKRSVVAVGELGEGERKGKDSEGIKE